MSVALNHHLSNLVMSLDIIQYGKAVWSCGLCGHEWQIPGQRKHLVLPWQVCSLDSNIRNISILNYIYIF